MEMKHTTLHIVMHSHQIHAAFLIHLSWPPPCFLWFPAASFWHKQKAADFCSHRSSVFSLAATVCGAAAANHVYQTPTLTLMICLLSVTLTAAKACRVSSLSPDSIRMQTTGKSTKIKKKGAFNLWCDKDLNGCIWELVTFTISGHFAPTFIPNPPAETLFSTVF